VALKALELLTLHRVPHHDGGVGASTHEVAVEEHLEAIYWLFGMSCEGLSEVVQSRIFDQLLWLRLLDLL